MMLGIRRTALVSLTTVAVCVVCVSLLAKSPSDPASAQPPSPEPVSTGAPHSNHPAAPQDAQTPSRQPTQAPSVELLACTKRGEATNFASYSLGRGFEGLSLSDQHRTCTIPEPVSPDVARVEARLPADARRPRDARLNFVSYLYGDCRAPPGEGGCPLPLEIQTWPRCERDPSDYAISAHNPLEAKLKVKGVPAHLYEGGLRLEVYTGESTVVVFGTDPDTVLRAGRALIKGPARPSDRVEDRAAIGALPSSTGPIACR